jgi:hypothetical protein
MGKLKIVTDRKDSAEAVRSAILAEMKRLEISLQVTERRIKAFEELYKTPSDTFVKELAAEDLKGGDIEYVEWAGELKIRDRLLEELRDLQEIEYVVN